MNKQGIQELADILLCDSERYDQGTFGHYEHEEEEEQTTCGTTCCMAGFAYAKKVGLKAFNEESRMSAPNSFSRFFEERRKFELKCINAGKELLGITESDEICPQIFQSTNQWPSDLQVKYNSSYSKADSVKVAIEALSRLREDGTIDPDPTAIHNEILSPVVAG